MESLSQQINQRKCQREKVRYEAPAVIYESLITTRAGTPSPFSFDHPSGVDPTDLFGNE